MAFGTCQIWTPSWLFPTEPLWPLSFQAPKPQGYCIHFVTSWLPMLSIALTSFQTTFICVEVNNSGGCVQPCLESWYGVLWVICSWVEVKTYLKFPLQHSNLAVQNGKNIGWNFIQFNSISSTMDMSQSRFTELQKPNKNYKVKIKLLFIFNIHP